MLGSLEAVTYHSTSNLVLNEATKIPCRSEMHESANRQLNTEPSNKWIDGVDGLLHTYIRRIKKRGFG